VSAGTTGARSRAAAGDGLDGRVALVTGASGALGAAVARELDSAGVRLALHYSSGRARAEAVQASLSQRSVLVEADLSSWEQTDAAAEEVSGALGPVDMLVNCAAIRRDVLMAMQGPAEWRRVIDVNLVGTFHACRAVVARMMQRRWGRIINIVSPAGLLASPGQTAYSASKAAVIGMTRSLAAECGRRGVTVNALSPGFMQTPMTESVPPAVLDALSSRLAIPRFGEPSEIARAVAFIARSPYMTGQVLSLDGGLANT
jgi:3-oxoacyl-[acyl-carrier protein] reductase